MYSIYINSFTLRIIGNRERTTENSAALGKLARTSFVTTVFDSLISRQALHFIHRFNLSLRGGLYPNEKIRPRCARSNRRERAITRASIMNIGTGIFMTHRAFGGAKYRNALSGVTGRKFPGRREEFFGKFIFPRFFLSP